MDQRPNPHAAQSEAHSTPAMPVRDNRLPARTRSRRAAVHELLARGLSRDAVAGELNVYIHTVRRFADAERAEELSAKAECRGPPGSTCSWTLSTSAGTREWPPPERSGSIIAVS